MRPVVERVDGAVEAGPVVAEQLQQARVEHQVATDQVPVERADAGSLYSELEYSTASVLGAGGRGAGLRAHPGCLELRTVTRHAHGGPGGTALDVTGAERAGLAHVRDWPPRRWPGGIRPLRSPAHVWAPIITAREGPDRPRHEVIFV